MSSPDFRGLLDTLGRLYADSVQFKYDPEQSAIIVMKGDSVLGSVRAEGALHTVIWAALSIAERKA